MDGADAAAVGRLARRPPPELREFLGAYDPVMAKLFLTTRALVLGAAPDASELIYDAYNAVTVAYSFSARLKEALAAAIDVRMWFVGLRFLAVFRLALPALAQ